MKGDAVQRNTIRALVLLEGMRKKMSSEKKYIEYIDISDRNNILLGIHGVPIKMGADNFSRKIDDLKGILKDPDISMRDINYIDLRFDDAVISPK